MLGWIKLGGKCRFCKEPFSLRYPIVEALTGLLFAGYYWAYFSAQVGPCHAEYHPLVIGDYGWLYGLDMMLLSGLLAASQIDAELFIIPLGIPWLMAPIAVLVHAVFDQPAGAGSVCVGPLAGALAAGAGLGTAISCILLKLGMLPASFAFGAPMTEVETEEFERQRRKSEKKSGDKGGRAKESTPIITGDEPREWSPGEVRREVSKELLFLLIPLAMGMLALLVVWQVKPVGRWWEAAASQRWLSAMLGSILGGLVGGFVVWITRILGSLGFGREAMGMGDVDLMVAVGAVLGGGPATVAFFLAPFFGILFAIYSLLTRKTREIPYGPYLSLATAFVMLFYCPIAAYFTPGMDNLGWILRRLAGADAG